MDPYAQHNAFLVLEFGTDYGSGGIGSLMQPLIGERVFGTLKPIGNERLWSVIRPF